MLEDCDITTPFTPTEFMAFVTDYCKKIGEMKVHPHFILKEFTALGMLENVEGKIRFRWKIAELHDKFGEAIGVKLTPRFIFTEADHGPNDNDGSKPIPWRGLKRYRF
jgi:hypothetical protein